MKIKQQGFTLIELAISLVIIGLIISVALSVSTTQLQLVRISETKKKEEAIKNSLISFIEHNNRLPCPAQGNLPTTDPNYGREVKSGAAPFCTIPNDATNTVVTGIVPWISLGITDDTATDGYYNRFTYQVVLTATTATPNYTPVAGNYTISAIQNGSSITMMLAGTVIKAVAVLVSHGANGYGAYLPSGAQLATAGAGPNELKNAGHTINFVMQDFSSATGNTFDDVIMPISVSDLLTPLITNGIIDSYNSVLNKSINVMLSAPMAGSAPYYSSTPAPGTFNITTSPSTTLDPWGNYLKSSTPLSLTCAGTGKVILNNIDPNTGTFITITKNQWLPVLMALGC